MDINRPVIAGAISTIIFALSRLPMLVKAYQTKDLRSYSLGQILLANVGNAMHSIYVFHLPPGPIWLLHTFHLVTTGLMLVWFCAMPGGQLVCGGSVLRIRTMSAWIFQAAPPPHTSIHERYPVEIPHVGYDGVLSFLYAGGE